MLASIIANLQNEALVQPAKLPMVRIDRGGGGPSFPGGYDVVDFLAAIQTFPEIAGEDTFVRAVRRQRWIGEVLPKIKEAREKREAGAFLAGAALADAAAEERHQAAVAAADERRKLIDQLKIEQLIKIIDEVRGIPASVVAPPASAPAPRRHGQTSSGAIVAAIAIGLGIGVALGRSSLGHGRRKKS